MKLLLVLVMLITTNAFASNEQLEAILKQYESTLTNHQVGMKSLALGEGISFIIDDGGVITTEPYRNEESSVILKVDGSKVYEYAITKDLLTGEQYRVVNLSEQKYESDESINYENINVANHVLSFAFTGIYAGEGSEAFSGVVTKELLQPFFCGFTSEINSIYTDSRTGQSFPLINKVNDSCDGFMSVADIKRLDLSNVEFCDMTLPDDTEDICETKDMSFLTADL